MEVFCVVEMQEARIPTSNVDFTYLSGGERVRTYTGPTGSFFSMFGGLEGDFCKDTCEAKLFVMHIGSVWSERSEPGDRYLFFFRYYLTTTDGPLIFEFGPDTSVVTCPWYPKRCSNFGFSIFDGFLAFFLFLGSFFDSFFT